jgi:hypothetical protein
LLAAVRQSIGVSLSLPLEEQSRRFILANTPTEIQEEGLRDEIS